MPPWARVAGRSFVPYIGPERDLREITIKGVILGIVLSVILSAANTYLGLRVGLTVSASIPAAVISMAVLRAFRNRNILENNAVQTAASAGESLAAGVLFTIPALLLLGYWSEVDYWTTTLVALAGGVLGVLFTVPLRRALIVEAELNFPEGVATAEVLKAGESADHVAAAESGHDRDQRTATPGGSGIGALVIGTVAGLAFKFMESGLELWKATAEKGRRFGDQGVASFGLDMSPALLAVGYIVGIRVAVLVFAGGVMGYLIAIPIYSMVTSSTLITLASGDIFNFALADPETAAGVIWSTRVRYIGAGAMLIGGLWSLLKLRGPLVQALRTSLNMGSPSAADGQAVPRTEQELGIRATFLGVLGMVIPIMALYYFVTKSFLVAGVLGLIMVVTGFLFSAIGGYMAGIVGSSNNPISGVTILTVLAAAFSLKLLGVDSTLGPAATILVAAVIACAGAIASDNMQDLKAGYLLGATPRRQQVMQIVGVTAAAFAVGPVLDLLHKAYTIGSPELVAPQAGLMQSIADGVFNGGLQTTMFAIGSAIAVALIILDEVLASRGASFRTPPMPVAVGIYLPVGLSSPIFLGGLLAWWAARRLARKEAPEGARTAGLRAGVLMSSGLIAGEALVGIAIAGIIVAGGGENPLALSDGSMTWPGLLLFGYVALVLWHVIQRPNMLAKAT